MRNTRILPMICAVMQRQDDILEVMRKFSEKYDEIFGDDDNEENKKD